MRYEQEITRLLFEVGEKGLPLQSIVKHVFNAHNTLFEPLKERNVYQSVRSYLLRNSLSTYSLYIKGEDGKFRINEQAPTFSQMQSLVFSDNMEDIPATSMVAEEPLLMFADS